MSDLELELLAEDDPNSYEVDLPTFQGPLDLLLDLIEQEELDITKISLARVTDQYLNHLEYLKETDPNDLTDFLVIAAKLILIKSEVLLPRPPPILADEKEEDVGDELARQLRLYKQFKEIAAHLRMLEEKEFRSYVRVTPKVKIEPKLLPGDGNLGALLEAARQAMTIKAEDPAVDEVVPREIVTIGQQMLKIWEEIQVGRQVHFEQLLVSHSRLELIVTLLATLELLKRRIIVMQQSNLFGEITIARNDNSQALKADWEELMEMTELS